MLNLWVILRQIKTRSRTQQGMLHSLRIDEDIADEAEHMKGFCLKIFLNINYLNNQWSSEKMRLNSLALIFLLL